MDKQILKLGARILENLPHMSSDVMQGWIDNPKALQGFLRGLVPPEKADDSTHLRHLLSLTLAPTSGSVTIAAAKEVFASNIIDPAFKMWGTNKAGADTEVTTVDVLEMNKHGTFKQLFESLGRDLYSLCLTQGHIVEFCRTHHEHLRQEEYETFFLFAVKSEGEEKYDLFVANVRVLDGLLGAYIHRFERGAIWNADHHLRLVVRQQAV